MSQHDWVKRPYVQEWDHDALLYLWTRSYCHSKSGMRIGAHKDRSDEEKIFVEEISPIISYLLSTQNVEVICDPDRAEPSEDGPPIIWAFACTSEDDIVHYALAKKNAIKAGLSGAMLEDLLGPKLQKRVFYTFEPVELSENRCREHSMERPKNWRPHPTWIATKIIGAL